MSTKLYRSTQDRRIAGICGGLGVWMHKDPTVVRVIVVAIGLLTAVLPLVLIYLAGWIIIPESPNA